MKNLILASLIMFLMINSWAQENGVPSSETPVPMSSQHPMVRPRPPEDPNKESSSFIGDPENLDPLRSQRDNLKEDTEPVLEDIRQVLDAPPPPAPEIIAPTEPQSPAPKAPEKPKKKVVRNKPLPQKKQVKAKASKKSKSSLVRRDDDPDEAMERRFYQNYMRYNSEPTSVEAWTTASLGRSEEVYIVQKGDTLWSISETLFGDSLFWPKIWALNRQGIVNPHFILPGMNVRFFPGSSEDVPTLAVGNQNLSGNTNDQNGVSSSGEPSEGFESSDGSVTSSGGSRSAYSPPEGTLVATLDGGPTPLPPSMPVYRSSRYFDKPQKIEIIDFNEPERLKVEYPVDIFFTDRFVLSDLKISLEGNNHLNCAPGEVVRNFEYIRRTPTDEYTILEVLPSVNLDTDKKKKEGDMLYSYRQVGTIAQYAEGKLRIKTCRATLSKDLLYVPTSVLPSLKTNKVSDKTPQIIGGPDVMNQNYYYDANFVYLDMGSLNFNLGQDFQVISERIDGPAGTVRILDRFGSYAIGIILKETQPIFLGDRIVSQ